MKFNKFYRAGLIIIGLFITVSLFSMLWINISTRKNIYSNINRLPYNRVGLIPGCNKYISDGVLNIYYTQRIDAGVILFKNNKIDYILVSGDNAHPSYDEPREMRNSLIEAGIPKNRIISDYAGFRTLDTIVRAKEVFRLDSFTLITQSFQNVRGVFIGKNRDLDVYAFNADYNDPKVDVSIITREYFAKIKMLLDIYILAEEPKFLGEEIIIGIDQ